MKLRVWLPLVLVAAGAGCSPAQEAAWRAWFRQDPDAAVTWARDECGALCTDDWDRDGVVEPEPELEADTDSGSSGWSDRTYSEPDLDVGWGSCPEWMGDALAAGWTSDQWATLNWIMERESGCSPGAYNSSSGASGLLQIMPMWAGPCGGGDLFDPWFNLACGLHVYHQQGWSAWSVY